jgi:hypothetical protein
MYYLTIVIKLIDLDTSCIYDYNHMVGMDKISSSETNIFLDYWMEKNAIIAIELDLLTSNIKRNICNVLDVFFFFS